MLQDEYFERAVCALKGKPLRPYQLEAVGWGLRGSCIFAHDMGLGKTLSALGVWYALKPRLTAIVTPTSARGVWLSDLQRFFGRKEIIELKGLKKLSANVLSLDGSPTRPYLGPDDPCQSDVYLISHDVVTAWGPLIQARAQGGIILSKADAELAAEMSSLVEPPELVIVDESHRFGKPKGQRWAGIMGLACKANRVICLSGTPMAGGTHRLWAQLKLCEPEKWGSYWSFAIRYDGAIEGQWGMELTGPTNVAELKAKIADTVFPLRRALLAHTLPKHIRTRVPVYLGGPEYRAAQAVIDGFWKEVQQRGRQAEPSSRFELGEVVKVLKALAHYKIPAVVEHAKAHILTGSKLLIWVWHKEIAKALEGPLLATSAPVFRIDGDTLDQQYQLALWKASPGSILIATMKKLGTGFDELAHHCQDQYVVELPWLPDDLDQALSRLVRLSQPGDTVYSKLFQLQIPFEKSVCDRVLSRAEESDDLLSDTTASGMKELMRATMSPKEALKLLGER